MGTMKGAAALLKEWDKILVLSHGSPDGDTLGSATALIRALRNMGKRAAFACADAPGSRYAYLFEDMEEDTFAPEKIVTVDVADIQLLGDLKTVYPRIDLAIDHHATGTEFALESWVEGGCAATAQMIYKLLLEMGAEITPAVADCLYTGISTDTGCFRYSSAGAETYRAAAALIDAGARSGLINRMMFDTKTRACIETERRVFSTMEFLCGGMLVCAYIPRALLAETGVDESDLEGIPSLVRGIEGVLVGLTLKEKEDGRWKVSVRAVSPVNASEICRKLGGGGHQGAAGCTLGNDFHEARAAILKACEETLAALCIQ